MLHQILCALQGKTGSIIKTYQSQLSVDPSVNYLQKPQIQLINEICKCGFYYHKITSLIDIERSEQTKTKLTLTKSPSIYRKAMYEGLKVAMKLYTQLILGIQQQFLKNRHFTLANIRAELLSFELIMKQVMEIIYHIYDKNMRGGIIIDYLYKKCSNSNKMVRQWLQQMLTSITNVFLSQCSSWLRFGLLQDPFTQFFIHSIIHSKTTPNWDMYTLQQAMIPTSLIQIQTAGKILFIGKSVRILKFAGRMVRVDVGMDSQFSQVQYQARIQLVRQQIAKEMILFVMKESNLLKELGKLNDYYLMFKGDFFHHFFEEAKAIQSIPQKEKAQKKINQVYLQNTFLRLGQDQDVKRIHFEMKPLGFSYNTFKNFTNLCPVGNIDLIQGKGIRLNSTGSALWHLKKQLIQSQFTMLFSFTFHPPIIKPIGMPTTPPTYLNLILQSSKQLTSIPHQNPAYLSRIPQYIALKMGFQYSQKEKNYVSSIILVYKDIRRGDKEQLLGVVTPKGLDFIQGNSWTVRLAYDKEIINAEIIGNGLDKANFKVDAIRISNYLDLQMGRAHLGFVSTINQPGFTVDLEKWQILCKPVAFYSSHWTDLCLSFSVSWPINLLITPSLLQSYSRVHKFLFPIRHLQICVQSIWFQIPRLIKSQLRSTKQQKNQLKIFQRNLSCLRGQMNLVVNCFWQYFLDDVAGVLWAKLSTMIQNQYDFQDVISAVNKYLKSIQVMYFFNVPKIQRKINQIFQKIKAFTIFFNHLLQNFIDENAYNELQRIDMQFNQKLTELYTLLKDLSKINTSQYLYHITTRIQSCLNPMKVARNA